MIERILSTIVELDIDRCQRVYGVSPCTAGRKNSGTAQAGSANTITLAAGASGVNDFYKNMTARITGGTGSGQERKISAYNGATKVATVTANWITNPDATSVYDVIDRPAACYNTYKTCQDRTNYLKGVKTLKFTERGAPITFGENTRPYIDSIAIAPTEIDPEAGLARRAMTILSCADEPDNDVEMDPYLRDRLVRAGGTFWARFIARNHNYAGRAARVKRAFVDGTTWGATTTEAFLIDSLKGPNRGDVKLTLKDPIVIANKIKIPIPTSGKLALALTVNDFQATLSAGDGTQYPSSGYVRIGDEVIQYTAKAGDVISWPDGTYRAKFGTAAMAGKIDAGVQLCQVWINAPISTVLKDLYNAIDPVSSAVRGLADADLDIAGMQSEDTNWLGQKFYVTTCLTDPEDADALIADLCKETGAVSWWSSIEQKAKYKVLGPQAPSALAYKKLTDAAHFLESSLTIEQLDELRLSFVAKKYALSSATANRGEDKNYAAGETHIDAGAESPNEYDGSRMEVTRSRWFGIANASAMRQWTARRISYYRDAPKRLSFKLDPKDGAIREGDLYDAETADLVDAAGQPLAERVLILRRQDNGRDLAIVARTTTFNRRYGFIAPAGTPNYPNNNDYACIAGADGRMSDGTEGYLII